jgi:hypothetical protein
MKKTLALIESKEGLAALENFIGRSGEKRAEGRFFVFSRDPVLRRLLAERGFGVSDSAENTGRELFGDVEGAAFRMARGWYRACGPSAEAVAFGMSLGRIVEKDLTYYFLGFLKNVDLARHVLTREMPERLLIEKPKRENEIEAGDFAFGKIAAAVFASTGGKEVEWLEGPGSRKPGFGTAAMRFFLRTKQVWKSFVKFSVLKWQRRFVNAVAAGDRAILGRKPAILISSAYPCVREVLEELLKRDCFEIVYLRHDQGADIPRKILSEPASVPGSRRVRFWFLRDYVNGASRREMSRCRESFRRNWPEAQRTLSESAVFDYKGVSLWDYVREKIRATYCFRFPLIVRNLHAVRELFKKEKITRLLLDEDVGTENRTVAAGAKTACVPALVVQHGFAGIPIGFAEPMADHIAVWGKFSVQKLLRWGFAEEGITVTGNPRYDYLCRADASDGAGEVAFRKSLGLNAGKKIILLAVFPYRDYSPSDFPDVDFSIAMLERLIRNAVCAAGDFRDAQLVIKLHPRDNIKKTRKLVDRIMKEEGRSEGVFVIRSDRNREWIRASHLVLTVWSSLSIEAMLLDRRCLIVDLAGDPEKTRGFAGPGFSIVGLEPAPLRAEIGKALEAAREFRYPAGDVQLYSFGNDGRCAARVTDLLGAMNNRAEFQPQCRAMTEKVPK